jgi:hypothetical protein
VPSAAEVSVGEKNWRSCVDGFRQEGQPDEILGMICSRKRDFSYGRERPMAAVEAIDPPCNSGLREHEHNKKDGLKTGHTQQQTPSTVDPRAPFRAASGQHFLPSKPRRAARPIGETARERQRASDMAHASHWPARRTPSPPANPSFGSCCANLKSAFQLSGLWIQVSSCGLNP